MFITISNDLIYLFFDSPRRILATLFISCQSAVKLETSKSQLLKFLQFNFLDNKYD
jgi:hypothetical protein